MYVPILFFKTTKLLPAPALIRGMIVVSTARLATIADLVQGMAPTFMTTGLKYMDLAV
jgi:hypothetical protein